MKRFWIILALLCALAAAATAASADDAHGSTRAQAISAGIYWSAQWCPHHSGGVCVKRTTTVQGSAPGPFRVIIQGWERGWWEPWMTVNHARWYYQRCATYTKDRRLVNGHWC